MIKKLIKKIKNSLFLKSRKKDLFEEMTTYKSDEEVYYDKEVFDWFFSDNDPSISSIKN